MNNFLKIKCFTVVTTMVNATRQTNKVINLTVDDLQKIILETVDVRVRDLKNEIQRLENVITDLIESNNAVIKAMKENRDHSSVRNYDEELDQQKESNAEEEQNSSLDSISSVTTVVSKNGEKCHVDKMTESGRIADGAVLVETKLLSANKTTKKYRTTNANKRYAETSVVSNQAQRGKEKPISFKEALEVPRNTNPKGISDDGFKKVVRKRKIQLVKGVSEPTSKIQGVQKYGYVYVGHIKGNVQEDIMQEHLQVNWPNCSFHVKKLETKGSNSSFKVSLELNNKQLLFDDSKWPSGVIVKDYVFFRNASTGIKHNVAQ